MLRDPRMSEWGNPAVAIPSLLLGGVERTRGTETSQYPQEEKITMIAPVVASERARAQTDGVTAPAGLKDRRERYNGRIAEESGKACRRG